MIINKKTDRISMTLIHAFFILLSLVFIVPMLSIIFIAFSNEKDIVMNGYPFSFREFDLAAFEYVFDNPMTILNAYKVTIFVSVVGTFLYLLVATMAAYSLSRNNFKYKKVITFYFFFTMLFNGGLVPSYILIKQVLHLTDTYWAMILPSLVNVWYLIILKTFMKDIPNEILESAHIDGAGQWRVYLSFIIPLSKPALATIGLLTLLDFWNSWMPAMLYIDSSAKYPLQYLLQVMLRNIMEILKDMQNNVPSGGMIELPSEGVRMAMCILAIGPMLFVFPCFQKYFTKGLTVGAVKG